jgi:hypothetical protein
MAIPNSALAGFLAASDATTPEVSSALAELERILRQAASLAAANGVSSDQFMSAAWHALLDRHPGLREQLEHQRITAELRELRKLGRVGSA